MNMNKTALQNSIEVLKILYMVVAGLAIAVGLERFVLNENGLFQVEWFTLSFWLFVIFITTVVRFVHGAVRAFDQSYIEEPDLVNWKISQPIADFTALGFEAFIFFLLAFSVENPISFIQYYLWLLLVDCAWVGITTPPPKRRIWTVHKWWLIANLIVLCPVLGLTDGSILWPSSQAIALYPPYIIWVFLAVVAAHTGMDYPLNWEFYFGRRWAPPWSKQPRGSTSVTPNSKTAIKETDKINVIFVAGAYYGNDFNKIEENIRLAESYSIHLWNRGYKVFCPHLNTQHFEVKAEVNEQAYREFDKGMLRCCDAVFALPNWQESEGAKEEITEAERLGKSVFYSLDDLPAKA